MAFARSLVLLGASALGFAAAARGRGANVGAGGRHLRSSQDLQPEVVADLLIKVEDAWKAQALEFAACNSSANVSCAKSSEAFEGSCSKVVDAIVKGSSGDRSIVSEYMGSVCGQKSLQGWKRGRCEGLAQALTSFMSADDYGNREHMDVAGLCRGLWHRFEEQEVEEYKKDLARQEKERQEAEKRAEEERQAEEKRREEEAKIAAEEAKKRAEEAERQKEEAEQKKAEEQRQAEETQKQEEAARQAAEAKKQAEAAAAELAAKPQNATEEDKRQQISEHQQPSVENATVTEQSVASASNASAASDAFTASNAPNASGKTNATAVAKANSSDSPGASSTAPGAVPTVAANVSSNSSVAEDESLRRRIATEVGVLKSFHATVENTSNVTLAQ